MLLQKILRPVMRAGQVAARRPSSSDSKTIITLEELSGVKKWKILSFVIVIPLVGVSYINAFHTDPEDHSPPEWIEYPHLRIRTKKFCWGDGDHTVIHNPQTNATSKGYEEEFVAHH